MQDYTLLLSKQLSEVSGTLNLWQHNKTKAQILSIQNTDENKCFGIALRTPPKDSTGVAHILEHSVLCGSKKYPVKEPFVELLKGSLQTFLNAFTFPDKTCYPVASVNLQDFYNLMDVYLDAVFFPKITPEIFQQEGFHVEAVALDEGIELSYKGVVYNEMKGVYSSPDSVLSEHSQQSLFPDITYGQDSGGNPEAILGLTYQAFKDFHTKHYHPSNARFFFWGDDPEEARLAKLKPYLDQFEYQKPGTEIPLQAAFDCPKYLEYPYASSEDDEADFAGEAETTGATGVAGSTGSMGSGEAAKAHLTMNWLLTETINLEEVLMLEMLEHILLALPGSPLRKALMDSGLGEDLTGSGLETDLRQSFFSVGLRSIVPGTQNQVEMLIMDTLAELAETGLPKADIEAALNSLEFDLRENNSGRFPVGLTAMLTCLTSWLYEADPSLGLAWEAPLKDLKDRLAKGDKIFEPALKKWFLDNEHRSTVVILPDSQLAAQKAQQEADKLAKLKSRLTPADLQELVAHTKALQEAQNTPDSPEALASIPCLQVADLPLQNTLIPAQTIIQAPLEILTHALDTRGIIYAELLLGLQAVPMQLLPLVPLYGRALTELGTSQYDFVTLGTRIASQTGGLGAGPFIATKLDQGLVCKLCLSGKATQDKASALFELMTQILTDLKLDNQARFKQLLLEERARLEQALIPSGHAVVMSRLRASLNTTGYLGEQLGGLSYLEFLRQLSSKVDSAWPEVLGQLQELHKAIVNSQGAILNLTSQKPEDYLGLVQKMGQALPNFTATAQLQLQVMPACNEVLVVPAQVNYVGAGADIYKLGYTWHGSAHVITRHMRMSWLWDQVRVQGGAYGVFCSLDRLTGAMVLASYRDPNTSQTLQAFAGCAQYLRQAQLSDRELSLAIIGAIGDLDTYLLPDAKGMASLTRHLSGDSVSIRQQMRDEILSTTKQHFSDFADIMAEVTKAQTICILGGEQAKNLGLAQGWDIKKVL